MTDAIIQTWLMLFTLLSVVLVNSSRPRVARWASVCGLLAQPAWFWVSYQAEQWSVFALTLVYTGAWLKGFYHYWGTRWI